MAGLMFPHHYGLRFCCGNEYKDKYLLRYLSCDFTWDPPKVYEMKAEGAILQVVKLTRERQH